MFYKYDTENLKYVKVSWITISLRITGMVALLLFAMGLTIRSNIKQDYTEEEVIVVMAQVNKFSEDKLITEIKNLNFKFPYIVFAQAKLETGNFKSQIFVENNNLFGMKEAKKRITTAEGTQYGHAYYESWTKSLFDYGFYFERNLSSFKSEEDYFSFLSKYYAEDPNYVSKLRSLIARENLNKKFN